MARVHLLLPRDLDISAETVFCYEAADTQTSGLTLTVSKAGGAFGTAAGTVAQVEDELFKLTTATSDTDTAGDLAYKVAGTTNDTIIYGLHIDAAAAVEDTHIDIEQDLEKATETTLLYEAPDTDTGLTLLVSKAGGAFGTSVSTVAQVDGHMFKLVTGTDDVDTSGAVAWKLTGGTNTTYLYGLQVVEHDPVEDVRLMRQVLAGKVVVDEAAGTIEVYAADGVTVLVTLTRTVDGDETTWTPS